MMTGATILLGWVVSIVSAVALPEPFPEASPDAAFIVDIEKVAPAHNLSDYAGNSPNAGCTFQAFSGNACDGNAGAIISVNGGGQCIGAYGRHSFLLGSGCPAINVIFYTGNGCSGNAFNSREGPGCYNVNTGQAWLSTFVNN